MGSFYWNNIEDTFSKLKRLTDNFSGLNWNIFNLHANLINNLDFLILIFAKVYFFMEYEHKKLTINPIKQLLINYLEIIYT